MNPERESEMDELKLVLARSRATGRPTAVAAFTGTERAQVVDFDEQGNATEVWSVPLVRPAPGSGRLPDGPEAAE